MAEKSVTQQQQMAVAEAAAEAMPPPVNASVPSSCSPDDLISLVRAVKFAHPEMSIRDVRNEIAETMAESDPSYAFLKDVELNDVKKVWKRALKGSLLGSSSSAASPETSVDPSTTTTTTAKKKNKDSSLQQNNGGTEGVQGRVVVKPIENQRNHHKIDSILPPSSSSDGILKFYTVGDGSVKTLTENYANHFAGAAVVANLEREVEREKKELLENYSHFFLDVPADRSGSRPHQALINFNDNRKGGKGNKGGRGGKKHSASKAGSKRREAKTSTLQSLQSQESDSDENENEIFKIQVAESPAGDVATPMLLYNADRTAKTFLHPPSAAQDEIDGEDKMEDDGGYFQIKKMIKESGTSGAHGSSGGQKAYFWGFITKTKTGPDVISIDIKSGLAPAQSW